MYWRKRYLPVLVDDGKKRLACADMIDMQPSVTSTPVVGTLHTEPYDPKLLHHDAVTLSKISPCTISVVCCSKRLIHFNSDFNYD